MMNGKEKVLDIINRGQKRQWLRYSIAFSFGAVFGISAASFAYIINQNDHLSKKVAELEGNVKKVNYLHDSKAIDLTIPPPPSF